MKDKLIITKKPIKGEDGYKTFSIRIKEDLAERLNTLAQKSNRSRNDLIQALLDYAVENCEIEDSIE